MHYRPNNPLIVQSDHTVLLETDHPAATKVREELATFAELVKSPAHLHTYRLTPLSLWNAAAATMSASEVVHCLTQWSKFDIPLTLIREIETQMNRYGLFYLEKRGTKIFLVAKEPSVLGKLVTEPTLGGCFAGDHTVGEGHVGCTDSVEIDAAARGRVKQLLLKLGYPVEDRAGYATGERLPIQLKQTVSGKPFALRPYQRAAVDAFYREGSMAGGSGLLVLPCGAGKTIIGLGIMEKVECETLILTPNATSVRQWIREILEKTDVPRDLVGEYTGAAKEVKPITVATYQILTHREGKEQPFSHMQLFAERDWGLIIYDEVHLLPAPVFRATASIQAKRRLGLTATLVREDGREEDVFSLVGPKKMDVSWKALETGGWLATATCLEVRTPLTYDRRRAYAKAGARQKYRVACENPRKIGVLKRIIARHNNHQILIIGQYLQQLELIATEIGAPLITGRTAQAAREELYRQFRLGILRILIVSKVANFAVDLPEATVAVQLSGSFGSRQEEAQRLGRILRPKKNNRAYFYTIVSRGTVDQAYALNRQRFLAEQGYTYRVVDAEDMEEEWL